MRGLRRGHRQRDETSRNTPVEGKPRITVAGQTCFGGVPVRIFDQSGNKDSFMAFRLSAPALEKTIKHLCKYGDTDVFPHLPELAFFRDESAAIVDELQRLDLDTYTPGGAIEALAPKSRYGFRITHQLGAVDTMLLLASVVEIGRLIEERRPPCTGIEAFSYRFHGDAEESLFLQNHTYKDWLHAQQSLVKGNLKIKQVVATDISDFYARINFHRLENLLDEAAPGHGATRYIKKSIKVIRVKQSFGLPVGGTGARLLAELALSDTDKALIDHGICATRFVDDFRIFLKAGEDPYEVLSFLAQQLSINEGLALNAAKTSVTSRSDFLRKTKGLTGDIANEAEGEALDSLTAEIYFDNTPAREDIEALKALNLLGFLQNEIGKDNHDSGRIKVIFRALKITKPFESVEYIAANFSELVVFAKEVTLLMQALEEDFPGCFEELTETVISAILEPPACNSLGRGCWSYLPATLSRSRPCSSRKSKTLRQFSTRDSFISSGAEPTTSISSASTRPTSDKCRRSNSLPSSPEPCVCPKTNTKTGWRH